MQDYLIGQKTASEQAQDYASDTYDAAANNAHSAYEAAAEAGSEAYASAGKVGRSRGHFSASSATPCPAAVVSTCACTRPPSPWGPCASEPGWLSTGEAWISTARLQPCKHAGAAGCLRQGEWGPSPAAPEAFTDRCCGHLRALWRGWQAAGKAKKHLDANGRAAHGQAKRAYDATAQAGSDAYQAAADTASDAYDAAASSVGGTQKSAKQVSSCTRLPRLQSRALRQPLQLQGFSCACQHVPPGLQVHRHCLMHPHALAGTWLCACSPQCAS